MRHSLRLRVFLLFSLLFIAFQQVSASKIPLGLNSNHGIFVQEFWQGTSLILCFSNRSNNDETVRVSRWQRDKVSTDFLFQWPLQAGSAQCNSANNLEGAQLLEFILDSGVRLGLLKIQRPEVLDRKRLGVEGAAAGISPVFANTKGPNGTCSAFNIWIEHSTLWSKSGELANVTLLTTAANNSLEFSVGTRLDLPLLQIKSMSSETLVIDSADNKFILTEGMLAAAPAVQQVQVELEIPVVMQPTMFILSGRQRIADTGWQCFIRGVMVAP